MIWIAPSEKDTDNAALEKHLWDASDARSSEQELRRQHIESRAVDVMVAVGPNMFYTVTLPCTLWFLDKSKSRSSRRESAQTSGKGKDQSGLTSAATSMGGGTSARADTLKEIEAQGWSLNPGRYVNVAPAEAVPNLNTGVLSSLPVRLPARKLQDHFTRLTFPMAEAHAALIAKIQNLCRTRDLLLPRLLSGQVNLRTN